MARQITLGGFYMKFDTLTYGLGLEYSHAYGHVAKIQLGPVEIGYEW